MYLTGKNVLLTNYSIGNYAGSEINCLTLANVLTQMGANVEIATLNYAYPIRTEFEKCHLKVKNVFFDTLESNHYDLRWSHHAVVLDYLLFELNISADRIIFSSLSPFEPLEAPPRYINHLSLCLANSQETYAQLVQEGVEPKHLQVFPNYVTQAMYERGPVQPALNLGKLAVVSNHIPDEVHRAVSILKNKGICVDYYGIGYNTVLVTEDLLANYDAIITIGKTVQYCLALGIPVYCYDIHGGPGWIIKSNLEIAASFNFSGRGFQKKSETEIAEEILNGYARICNDLPDLRKYIASNCLLEKNLEHIISLTEQCSTVDSDLIRHKYAALLRWNRALIQLYRYNLHREMKIVELNEQLKNKTNIENTIMEKIEDFRSDCKKMVAPMDGHPSEKDDEVQWLEEQISVEIAKQAAVFQKQLEECQLNFEAKIRQLEAELVNRQNIIDRKNIELDQNEANTRYLMEVVALKDQHIGQIYCSKGWRFILFYRRIKNGIIRRLKRLLSIIKPAKNILPQISEKGSEHSASGQDNSAETVPMVTVAIPVYDRTDVLIESIDSILNQTYPNIEIIAVCDGSPEETLKIIRSYEAKGKIRAFYYPDNSGNAVRGRNKAIREARGVYFAFQDSDDIAEPTRIATSIEYLEKYSADVVYGGWRALVDGSREIDIENGQEVFSPDCDYAMLKELCVPCQSTVLTKTDILRKVGGLKTNMRYREDHELWLRMAYYGYKFKAVDKILTNLRLHNGNLELSFKEGDEKWFNLMQEEHKIIVPMKPKIAYLIPGCGISGGIAVICQHLNRLRDRGYDVLMISETPETLINWFPNQRVEIVTLENVPDNIDALVATGWTTAHTAQNIPAKKKYYFVQSDETRFNPEGSYTYQKALETYSMDYQFITEAKWIKKWLMERFGKNAFYVPNGLDPQIMYCTEKRTEIPDRKIRVLLEGPIDIPFKAMDDAFNAINGLDCEVWCISSAGTPKHGWRCDKFFNNVPMEQMKYIYSNCDILLKMSRVEGFFGPPMEMMACGGTCVVGKVTGYDEYIVDGYNALTVELGDVQAAHDAVDRLIHDHELRNTLAKNGIKTASEWQWDPSIDTLEKIFTSNY